MTSINLSPKMDLARGIALSILAVALIFILFQPSSTLTSMALNLIIGIAWALMYTMRTTALNALATLSSFVVVLLLIITNDRTNNFVFCASIVNTLLIVAALISMIRYNLKH